MTNTNTNSPAPRMHPDEALGEHVTLTSGPADDPVNHPSHYTQGGIECIDAIKAALTPEEFRGYCKGNAMKYIWREQHKNGAQDIKKARWYIDRLSKEVEK